MDELVQGEDFAALLEESFSMQDVRRGQMLTGTVLYVDAHGAIVDVNMKRDGVIPRSDIERLDRESALINTGDTISVMVVNTEDSDGNLILSMHQARQSVDWDRAHGLMDEGSLYHGTVAAANRGGLIVPFGDVRGFVPASHVAGLPRGLDDNERQERLSAYVGKKVDLKIIEVNAERRRLVLSEREAQREDRNRRKQVLLEELKEGDLCTGVVSGLRDFGAFVDLGGADGLIHISELAWHRVRHPGEIVTVGQELEVHILHLDVEKRRIGLSLKRLQENPWSEVEQHFEVNQTVEGTVSRVVSFGAFIELDNGIEALLHTSEISDPPPADPSLSVFEGERLLLRVVSIEAGKQRMGLSLKAVTEEERAEWRAIIAAQQAEAEETEQVELNGEEQPEFDGVAEEEMEEMMEDFSEEPQAQAEN